MLIGVFSKVVNSKKFCDKKITAKLNIALYFFFQFDPISFHQSRNGLQVKRKTKSFLRKNINLVKWLFYRLFLNFQHNSKQNCEKDFLIFDNFSSPLSSQFKARNGIEFPYNEVVEKTPRHQRGPFSIRRFWPEHGPNNNRTAFHIQNVIRRKIHRQAM